jgi:hypothetical protein
MDLDRLLPLLALRHRIQAPDSAEGRARLEALAGRPIDPAEFAAAMARLLAAGLIHDPVNLPAGALQCHWRLDLTPEGFASVQAMLRERGMGADALIAEIVSP